MYGLEPTLAHYLILSAALFSIGLLGMVANRRNILIMLMSLELLLLAGNLNFVAFSAFLGDVSGQVMVMFNLAITAAESAIGLALLIAYFRRVKSVDVRSMNTMKG
jgi:NADH-quinone oxidoreductase subunit K